MSEVQLESSACLFGRAPSSHNQSSHSENWNIAKLDSAFHFTSYA
jgi:hypothetical protein